RNLLPDRHAGDAEVAASPVVALHQHAYGISAILRIEPSRGRPDPALELVVDHSGAAADTALYDAAAASTVHRGPGVLFRDVKPVDVVEHAVPRLRYHRQRPFVRSEEHTSELQSPDHL